MTQQEFENRVKMTVSASEFEAINEVYMNCDLDKDEFCKGWVKMNKSRVAKAEAERKAEEQRQADIETAYEVYNKLNNEKDYAKLAVSVLTDKEESFAERIGIALREWSSYYGCEMFRQVLSVTYDFGKFCGAIA